MFYMILTATYSEIAENKKAKQKNLHQQKKPKLYSVYTCVSA